MDVVGTVHWGWASVVQHMWKDAGNMISVCWCVTVANHPDLSGLPFSGISFRNGRPPWEEGVKTSLGAGVSSSWPSHQPLFPCEIMKNKRVLLSCVYFSLGILWLLLLFICFSFFSARGSCILGWVHPVIQLNLAWISWSSSLRLLSSGRYEPPCWADVVGMDPQYTHCVSSLVVSTQGVFLPSYICKVFTEAHRFLYDILISMKFRHTWKKWAKTLKCFVVLSTTLYVEIFYKNFYYLFMYECRGLNPVFVTGVTLSPLWWSAGAWPSRYTFNHPNNFVL